MINYFTSQNLKIPISIFFQTVKRVRNYKDFVPWCKDSWDTDSYTNTYTDTCTDNKNKFMTYDQIIRTFPTLIKNTNSSKKLIEIFNENNQICQYKKIKVKNYDGGITVGFNILDFQYISNVIVIEPNIILSVTDGSKSNVFKKLESLWIINEDKIKDEIIVDYYINFEFKSLVFSQVTHLFLEFLGENILKSFIEKSKQDMKLIENSVYVENMQKMNELEFSQIVDYKFEKILSEVSVNEKAKLKKMLNNLFELKKINLQELEKLVNVLKYNTTFLNKLLFLSDIAIWNNHIQLEKIRREISSEVRI